MKTNVVLLLCIIAGSFGVKYFYTKSFTETVEENKICSVREKSSFVNTHNGLMPDPLISYYVNINLDGKDICVAVDSDFYESVDSTTDVVFTEKVYNNQIQTVRKYFLNDTEVHVLNYFE